MNSFLQAEMFCCTFDLWLPGCHMEDVFRWQRRNKQRKEREPQGSAHLLPMLAWGDTSVPRVLLDHLPGE